VYSPTSVTKKELVEMISDTYDLDIKVNPFETPNKCDRTISSIRNDVTIVVPELRQQVKEMKDFYDGLIKH
jgi:hypothetical protein